MRARAACRAGDLAGRNAEQFAVPLLGHSSTVCCQAGTCLTAAIPPKSCAFATAKAEMPGLFQVANAEVTRRPGKRLAGIVVL